MDKYKLSTAGVLWAAVVLAGCEPRDVPQPKVEAEDSVSARAERKIDEVRAEARQEIAEARDRARQVGRDVQAGGEQASRDLERLGERAGGKVSDAAITTAVNAELARDASLSATRIDVDTDGGKVALRGSAPNDAARERATQIASQVKGVTGVDNQLHVTTNL
ncbi:MAG: BON domain-containing protein [Rhizobacter sp.]